MQSLRKNWFLVPKITWGIWWILMRAVASLKICNLVCYFCQKYIIFEPKKYRRVMCRNNWRMMQNLKRNWLVLWKMTWEIWRNLTQHSKVSNGHFNGLLLTNVYNVWAKKVQSYGSLYWRSMQMLKEKWLVVSKMKWGIWWISPEHLQILKFAIWETFPSKVYDVELKHYRGVMCHDTEEWCIKKNNWLVVWKMT